MKDMKKLIVALALILSAPAYAQTRRAMTIDDVLDLVQVSFREPAHQRIRDAEEIRWLMKYTLGREWKAPQRTDRKDERKTTTP